MFPAKRYIIVLSLALLAVNTQAQDLTGTWEGDLGSDQYLQLNIIQTGNKVCGYTRDHVKADQRSFCKAFFEGNYDKQKKKLYITGKYFLQNSGNHTLMKLNLTYKTGSDGLEILEEKQTAASILSSIISGFGGMFSDDTAEAVPISQYVNLKRIADQPAEMLALMNDCIARDKKVTDTVVQIIRKDSVPEIVQIITPEKPKDSLPPIVQVPVEIKKDTVLSIQKALAQRKNKEQSHITVNTRSINLKVYDNAIVDGDTVSILYNGKMLLTHQLLSEKAIEINLELDPNQTHHEIVLFAENLGSIPPNTALIVITAGDKRYELFASASLEENAVLVFDYKPK